MQLFGDASAIGGSAFMGHPDTGERLHLAIQNWDADTQQTSSGLREVLQMAATAMAALQHYPQLVRNRKLQYTSDSTAAVAAALNMKGGHGMAEPIRLMYETATAQGVQLLFSWQPRTTAAMTFADELSRMPGVGDIFVSHSTYTDVSQLHYTAPEGHQRRWGWSTVDVCAGSGAAEHVVLDYFTEYPAAGA